MIMSRPVIAYGIDVSEHNKGINFATLHPRPSFVIVRASYGCVKDKCVDTFISQLDKLSIPYGVYVYSYATNIESAQKEARFLLDLISKWNVRVGVWYDMEDADGYKERKGVNTPSLITGMCKAFCSIVEDAGYYVGIYSSLSWFNSKILGLNQYDKWVAYWGTPNDGKKRTDASSMGSMQQYSSTNGKLDVDCTFQDLSVYNIHPKNQKSLDEYAVEVWEGKWGTGYNRVKALNATKYGYAKIQSRVEDYGRMARIVWKGLLGDGEERKRKLIALGYSPELVQRVVNVYKG